MDTMAGFLNRILLLGAVVWITASANLMMEYNWPEPKQTIDRFPHESSCHYFYLMLSEEDITIEKCPDGQLFDYVKHSCISDREHIHCWSRHFGKMKHGHMHIKHKKHFKCPYPWGKYPNLHDCTKYHLCLNGRSKVKKCAPFELFDKISRKCIASIDAVCADRTDVVEHGYICPKTWGSFTYLKDCSKYYECLQKKPTLRTCQKGFLFDDRLAKCAPKEHVYCGLRHNPYGKVSSNVPETPSVPSTSFVQKSTSPVLDITTITATDKTISTSQDTSTSLKEVKSTPQETPTILKELTSISQETSLKDVSSIPPERSSNLKELTSISQETSPKDVSSTPQETSSDLKEDTSTQAPSKQPITNEISSPSLVVKDNNEETKQESSIVATNPTVGLQNEEQQNLNEVTQDVSGKEEFVEVSSKTEKEQVTISSESASDDEPLKKDVSTEEKDPNDIFGKLVTETIQENERPSEASKDPLATVSKAGCLPEDAMCVTEKDGTVVKCSSTKDLQPHPKDERRFLDCTGSRIQIYTCPPNLTFLPDMKKCKWQFIMGPK